MAVDYARWAKKIFQVNAILYCVVALIYTVKLFVFVSNCSYCNPLILNCIETCNESITWTHSGFIVWFYFDITIQFGFIFLKIYYNTLLSFAVNESIPNVKMWTIIYISHLFYFFISCIFEITILNVNVRVLSINMGLYGLILLMILYYGIILVQVYFMFNYYLKLLGGDMI